MDGEKMTWRAKTSLYKSTVSEDRWLHSWLRARGSNPRRCTLKRTQPVQEGRGKRIASTLVFRKVVEKNFAQISLHRLTFREKNNKQNVPLFIRLHEAWIPKAILLRKGIFSTPKASKGVPVYIMRSLVMLAVKFHVSWVLRTKETKSDGANE